MSRARFGHARLKLFCRQRFLAAFGLGLLLVGASAGQNAFAAYNESAFITELAQQTILTMSNAALSPADRAGRFAVIVAHDFDVPKIARFVLARNWEEATEAEREDLTNIVRDYLVRAYSSQFAGSGIASFGVTNQHAEGEATVIVRTQIAPGETAKSVIVEWQVVKMANGFRIIDLSIDGISFAVAQQKEIAAALAGNGGRIGELLQQLRMRGPLQQSRTNEIVQQLRVGLADSKPSER